MNTFPTPDSDEIEELKKRKEWTLIQAVCVAVGIKSTGDTWLELSCQKYGPEFDRFEKITYALRLEGQKEKPGFSVKRYTILSMEEDPIADIIPEFCRSAGLSDEVREMACFDPKEFIAWIATEKIIDLDREWDVKLDEDGLYTWVFPPWNGRSILEDLCRKRVVDEYKRKAYWTLDESANLLAGFAPYDGFPERIVATKHPEESPENLIDNIKRACEIGELDSLDLSGNQGLDAPDFPPELKIAFQAWNAVYNTPGGFDKKKSNKKNIELWLNQNYKNLSKRLIDRIVQVVNFNKKGGATPIN